MPLITRTLRERRPATALVTVLAVASLAGCATAAPYNPGRLASDQLTRVGEICESVLRVRPGDQHFDGCVESLSESLTSARQFAVAPSSEEGTSGLAASSRSYFYASAAEVRRREQRSCVRLGLDPVSGGFASCVANLAGTLEGIDLPPD